MITCSLASPPNPPPLAPAHRKGSLPVTAPIVPIMYCKLSVAPAMLGCLAWLTTLASAQALPPALAPRHHDPEDNTTILLDPTKLPLCFGSSGNQNLVQQEPLRWPVKGSPVALFTHEPSSIWEFRIIPQSDINVVKQGWQAIAPLVNQTGAGECCITRIIGQEPLLDISSVVQVHQHVNDTHSYHQCAIVRFVRAPADPTPGSCVTGDTVEAAWTRAFSPGTGGGPDEPALPVVPAGLESSNCPRMDDVDLADRPAMSYVVLGSATDAPCVMLLHPMDPRDLAEEISRMIPSGAADRPSRMLLGLWTLGVALALL
ncbi:hypothetical protein RB595_007400 [Gaeumannomyces hyphopodioides]